MDFFSSQNTEFFDALEEILEGRTSVHESDNSLSLHSNFISLFRPASSKGESELPYPPEQVLTMQLFSPSTKNSYATVKALIGNVNKIASRQGYNVVKKRETKKQK